MGISKENLGVVVEEIKISNDDSYPSKGDLNKLSDKVDNISISQRAVNKRGIKELLDQEVIFPMGLASTNGTGKDTLIDKTIELSGSIENYDFLQIYAKVNSTTRKFNYNATTLNLPIVYNNSDTNNLQDNSSVYIIFSQGATTAGTFGAFHFVVFGWFKSPTQFYIRSVTNPLTNTEYNAFSISSIKGVKLDSVIIDPVEHVNANSGIEDTPVGSVISLMGKTAPNHYLICDGTIYNIIDYPYLAQYIKNQFGTFNFFGGDGTDTFAVPDLRGEFLRGTGTAARNSGTGGEIGVHQDATIYPNIGGNYNDKIYLYRGQDGNTWAKNVDKAINVNNGRISTASITKDIVSDWDHFLNYTSRPTNTAVLYCIKYEPTYFMNIQGMIEETTLWEGNAGSSGSKSVYNSIDLSDSIENYDKIVIHYAAFDGNYYMSTQDLYKYDFDRVINDSEGKHRISLQWGYGSSVDFTTISKGTTYRKLYVSQFKSFVTKVIGVKYKTFQKTQEGSD